MYRRLLASAALGLSCCMALTAPASADVKAGVDAWAAGDYEAAVGQWREPALAGDPDAQFNLGQAYRLGRGVPANLDIALDWFRKASAPRDGGIIHRKAADEYGLTLFQTGQREQALPYIETAAQRGEPRALYVLGTAYFNGKLVEKDWVRGYALMSRAANAGIPAAQRSLSQMDGYVSETQKSQALAMAASMQAGQPVPAATSGFPVAAAEPAPVAHPVDLPPSQTAGADFAPPPRAQDVADSPAPMPAMAETPAPARAEAPAATPVVDDQPIAQIAQVEDIPGYVPSVPARIASPETASPAPASLAEPPPAAAAAPAAAAGPLACSAGRVQHRDPRPRAVRYAGGQGRRPVWHPAFPGRCRQRYPAADRPVRKQIRRRQNVRGGQACGQWVLQPEEIALNPPPTHCGARPAHRARQ